MTKEELLKLIPEDQQTDVAEFIDQAIKPSEGYVNLNEIKSPENVEKLLKENKALNAQFQSLLSKKNADYDRRFQEEKLPEIIETERKKIETEVNPEETPEQKRIKKLEQDLAERDAKQKENQLKDELRVYAKDKGVDPDMASNLSSMGKDSAIAQIDTWRDFIEKEKQAVIEKYKGVGNTPPTNNQVATNGPMSKVDYLKQKFQQAQKS